MTKATVNEFWDRIAQASRMGWRLDKSEAHTLVGLGVIIGVIDPSRAAKLIRMLQSGQTMLREDGQWACTTCGGNCGQCGDTDFYGNIGITGLDHIARTNAGRHSLPVYSRKWSWSRIKALMGF